MALKSYQDLKITIVRATSSPASIVKLASDLTQKKITNDDDLIIRPASKELHRFLVRANHHSIFEHGIITVLIQDVSRSFLAQITRHRMASYTAASQHYQEYSDYDDIVSREAKDSGFIQLVLEKATDNYLRAIETGIKSEINNYLL